MYQPKREVILRPSAGQLDAEGKEILNRIDLYIAKHAGANSPGSGLYAILSALRGFDVASQPGKSSLTGSVRMAALPSAAKRNQVGDYNASLGVVVEVSRSVWNGNNDHFRQHLIAAFKALGLGLVVTD